MLVVPIAQDGCLPTTKCKIANTYRKKRALLFAAGAFQTLEHSSSTCFELKAVTEAEKQTVTLKDDRIETEACYKTLCAAFNKTATTPPFDPDSTRFPTRKELPDIPGAPPGAAWVWGENDYVC